MLNVINNNNGDVIMSISKYIQLYVYFDVIQLNKHGKLSEKIRSGAIKILIPLITLVLILNVINNINQDAIMSISKYVQLYVIINVQ